MKKARFTETQIVNILKLADSGMKVEDICRQKGAEMSLIIIGNQSMVAWNLEPIPKGIVR